jgi:hypothetical protein
MSSSDDTPPQSPLFGDAPGASPSDVGKNPWTPEERKKIDQVKALIKEGKFGGRASDQPHIIKPYLLLRSFTGDNGTRPFNTVFWESPDIWTAVGDPAVTPAIPPTHGGVLPVGQKNTVYAHVWNLGRVPAVGVVVDFFWFNPSLAIDGAHKNHIGVNRVDLGPRNSPTCHQLVKCPKPWVPVMENGGHECLVVTVSGFGDQIGANVWTPQSDRHVAQRNVAVVADTAGMQRIISRFDLALHVNARIELTLANAEAADAARIVAPHLHVDPAQRALTLANLDHQGLPSRIAAGAPDMAPVARSPVLAASALTHGVGSAMLASLKAVRPSPAGRAQVVRISQYDGTQLTGGYTFVVGSET